MKKILVLILSSVLMQASSLAQRGFDPGYIVTAGSDTIRGFIRLHSNYLNGKTCVFMKPGNAAPESFSPEQIKSYRIENKKYYIARDVMVDSTSKKVFLEYLVHGIVDLYYLKEFRNEYFYLDNGKSLIQMDNNVKRITKTKDQGTTNEYEAVYDQPSNQYKRIMTVLFQDSPRIVEKLPDLGFNYKSLVNITVDYHNSVCSDRECINYVKSTGRKIYLEPWISYRIENMGLAESDQTTRSSGIGAGVSIRLKPFKGYSDWDLLFGLGFSSCSFDGNYKSTIESITDPPYLTNFHLHADYNLFMLPISMEYTLPLKKVRPFLSVSFINALAPVKEYYYQDLDHAYDPVSSHWRNYQFGVAGGGGIKLFTSSGSPIILKGEISYRKPSADFGWVFDKTSVLTYSLGLGYGIRIK